MVWSSQWVPSGVRNVRRPLQAIGLIIPAALAWPAQAQIDPGVLNPGVLQRENLPQPQLPQPEQGPLPPLFQQPKPQPKPAEPEEQVSIRRVVFEGNTAISAEGLQTITKPLLEKAVTFAEIQAAVEAITAFYRSQGYVLSQALLPKNALANGVLRVQIVEGFIEKVEVLPSNTGFSRWLSRYMSPVVGSAPLRLDRLERQILLAQSISGLTVESVLSPGELAGSAVLTLKTQRDITSASLSIDNWVPQQLGNVRGSASANANPFGLGRPWALGVIGSYTWPYTNGLTNGVVTASSPWGKNGLLASGSFSFTDTNSTNLNTSNSPGFLQTQGESWYGSLSLRYPLQLSRRSNLFITLQGDLQNSYSDLYLDNTLIQNNSIDRLRALRLRLDGAWAGNNGSSQASLLLSQGLPIWGADNGPDPVVELSNPYGSVSFSTARLSLGHQQRLGAGNSPWLLNLKGEGQISGSPLPSSEQLGYGGANYGRAFRSVYTLGDQGALASVELAYNTPAWLGLLWQPYAFFDLGYTSLRETAPGFPTNQTASSVGLGLRLFSLNGNWLNLDTGWGIPASNTVPGGGVGPGNSIVYARATLNF